MTRRRTPTPLPLEHPDVAPVEAILWAATRPYDAIPLAPADLPHADHALWICACVSEEDAPTWLVHDAPADHIAWCRIPSGADVPSLVEARLVAGGHTDATSMLRWLRGEQSQPPGDVDGDEAVFNELRLLIQRPRPQDTVN